jgi:hypothetical protein
MVLVSVHATLLPGLQHEVREPEVLPRIIGVQMPAVQVDGRTATVLDDRVLVALNLLDLAVVVDVRDLYVSRRCRRLCGWDRCWTGRHCCSTWRQRCGAGRCWCKRYWRRCWWYVCRSWSPDADLSGPCLLLPVGEQLLTTDIGPVGDRPGIAPPHQLGVDKHPVGKVDVA